MNPESLICLEGKIYCTVTRYHRNVYVSFRELVSYDDDTVNLYPTRNGITLNQDQYHKLLNEAEKLGRQVSGSPVGVPFGKTNVVDLTGNKTVSVFHGYTPTEETLYVLFEDMVKPEKKIYLSASQFMSWMEKREKVAEKIEWQTEELKKTATT